MAEALEQLVDEIINVVTCDGRNIVGVLKGFDQATNIILDESHEREWSLEHGVKVHDLGLYIIRGDNVAVVGEVDEDAELARDLNKQTGEPLKPVVH